MQLAYIMAIPVVLVVGIVFGYLLADYLSTRDTDQSTPTSLGPITVYEISISDDEIESFFKDTDSWEESRFDSFLSMFMLDRELLVLKALAIALVYDTDSLQDRSQGWRNRHRIHQLSGLSKKMIYGGKVLERLVRLGLVLLDDDRIVRKERIQYRINTDRHLLMNYSRVLKNTAKDDLPV